MALFIYFPSLFLLSLFYYSDSFVNSVLPQQFISDCPHNIFQPNLIHFFGKISKKKNCLNKKACNKLFLFLFLPEPNSDSQWWVFPLCQVSQISNIYSTLFSEILVTLPDSSLYIICSYRYSVVNECQQSLM